MLNKCIIFGFPSDSDVIEILNYCVLYAKYYIYIQHLYNNNKLHLFAYMSQLNQNQKSNQILFKVSNVLLKQKKINNKLFTRLYSITNNNKLYI